MLESKTRLRYRHDWARFLLLGLLALVTFVSPVAFGGWIDDDTPKDKRVLRSLIDGTDYDLVMSDEFNVPGRTFADGDDPTWTALDKSDDDSSAAGGGSLHFYNSSMITTNKDGYLEIRTALGKTEWEHYDIMKKKYKHVEKYFKSGMLQSWNKFCFTGGIVEVDIIFPGAPSIGGLWPAVWMLGNIGRATYEASTNNIWPWSYNTCDRSLQEAQSISACNSQNHFGLHPHMGRGATEIDLIEVMTGYSDGPLKGTDPPVSIPYADLTLQVAPGVPDNRPQSGALPRRKSSISKDGRTELLAQTWYEGLEVEGNTTINPYFYGTYLGVTKPDEPVQRNKNQVFQADAVGAMHQLVPSHFEKMHTFRVEWQPGANGRLDWFAKTYDGSHEGWLHAFSIQDESLSSLTGAQIPNEPSSLIINTAISSNWGFPYSFPDWCTKCYDCSNATCACSFNPGFCNMFKESEVAMYIDHVRVYQSNNHTAHVGSPHTVGCDPLEYPTREFIKGHEYRYMRDMPFSYDDKHPLKDIKNGGGACVKDSDCGGDISNKTNGYGQCVLDTYKGIFGKTNSQRQCSCNEGYTGPRCLTKAKKDDYPGAFELHSDSAIFYDLPKPKLPIVLVTGIVTLLLGMIVVLSTHVVQKQREIRSLTMSTTDKIPFLS